MNIHRQVEKDIKKQRVDHLRHLISPEAKAEARRMERMKTERRKMTPPLKHVMTHCEKVRLNCTW